VECRADSRRDYRRFFELASLMLRMSIAPRDTRFWCDIWGLEPGLKQYSRTSQLNARCKACQPAFRPRTMSKSFIAGTIMEIAVNPYATQIQKDTPRLPPSRKSVIA
jgi:hypothetical protein